MTFWPTGPVTTLSMAVIFSIAVAFLLYGDRAQKHIALALLISWIGARLSTPDQSPIYTLVTLTIAFIISFHGFTEASRAIASLYVARVLLLGLPVAGAVSWVVFWDLNRFLLALQIAIAIGTTLDGGHRKIFPRIRRVGWRGTSVRPLALWRHYVVGNRGAGKDC